MINLILKIIMLLGININFIYLYWILNILIYVNFKYNINKLGLASGRFTLGIVE